MSKNLEQFDERKKELAIAHDGLKMEEICETNVCLFVYSEINFASIGKELRRGVIKRKHEFALLAIKTHPEVSCIESRIESNRAGPGWVSAERGAVFSC